eukprot:15469044-Heterocapsa_arctica.AAC.1
MQSTAVSCLRVDGAPFHDGVTFFSKRFCAAQRMAVQEGCAFRERGGYREPVFRKHLCVTHVSAC